MKALIVYSGGLDSTVLLHYAKEEITHAVSFEYGSKHNERELSYAQMNCKALGIPWYPIKLTFIAQFFKSALLKGQGEIPTGGYTQESLKSTVVPFRNGIMLSVATGLAESLGCDTVLIANHTGDHSVYPDCRPGFVESMEEAMSRGTHSKVRLMAPFTNLKKRQIAEMGKSLGVDFSETWSCYEGGRLHCGKCSTCSERMSALVGFDNTEYRL